MEREDLLRFSLPRYRQIPDIGLLLEQTVRLINGYLEPLGSVSLTPSMVSNYVKHGIIDRAVKKQYGRDQLACLIFIAIAKTVLTLDDIARLIELQRGYCELELAYDRFCDEFEMAIAGRPARELVYADCSRNMCGQGSPAPIGGNDAGDVSCGLRGKKTASDLHAVDFDDAGQMSDAALDVNSGFRIADIPHLREVLCDIAAVSSMSILLRMKLEQLG